MSSIDAAFEDKVGKQLALIEEMRASLHEEDIQCPGVVVVGAQSSGKSSVLERLTGLGFPREPEFLPLQTKNATEPAEIGDILRDYQQELTSTARISDQPIYIRYTRQHGPVMTLIDLQSCTRMDTKD